MRFDRATEEAAKEVLPLLPGLVGADAPRIASEINRALSASSYHANSGALNQTLRADARVWAWVEQRLDQGSDRNISPGGSGYQALLGDSTSGTRATKFVCRTQSCSQPDTWLRSFVGEPVPRCSGCTRLLSRETG